MRNWKPLCNQELSCNQEFWPAEARLAKELLASGGPVLDTGVSPLLADDNPTEIVPAC
jgi:hypothetical protein